MAVLVTGSVKAVEMASRLSVLTVAAADGQVVGLLLQELVSLVGQKKGHETEQLSTEPVGLVAALFESWELELVLIDPFAVKLLVAVNEALGGETNSDGVEQLMCQEPA